MRISIIFKSLLIILLIGVKYTFAAINLTVSPIKYEIVGKEGTSITKTATLHNRGNKDISIITGKSDFVANGTDGSPSFVRYSELVHPDQQLSSWITLSSSGFIIPAKSKKEITFTINIPKNATPGGHYGAVFFKNNNSESSNSGGKSVGINVDYGIIILLKVEGEIVTDVVIDDSKIEIIGGHSGTSSKKYDTDNINNNKSENVKVKNFLERDKDLENNENRKNYNLVSDKENNNKKDNCFIDFTTSRYDGKCFEEKEKILDIALGKDLEIIKDKEKNNTNTGELGKINNLENKNSKDKNKENFNISFKIPVENKGNTHIQTTGEIKLFDEDGKQIKQIGKKVRVNEKGAIIGEDIVDYIPVNDNKGNVLPGTKRIFNPQWEGFPYKKYSQELGKEIIEYKNPGEYYTDASLKKEFRLMPWERICYDKQNKKITAKFDLSYLDEEGKEVSFPSAKEFNIEYTRKYVGYNYYFIALAFISFLLFILFLFILFWIIGLFTKKRCINKDCRKKIKRKLKVCPYCKTIQKKEKKKKKTEIKPVKKISKNKKIAKKSDEKKSEKSTSKPVKKKITKKSKKTKK